MTEMRSSGYVDDMSDLKDGLNSDTVKVLFAVYGTVTRDGYGKPALRMTVTGSEDFMLDVAKTDPAWFDNMAATVRMKLQNVQVKRNRELGP